VGSTCESVHAQTFNNNLKELGVVKSKRNTVRKGLVHELLHAQDTVLCSYFAQRSGEQGCTRVRVVAEKVRWKKLSKGWTTLNEIWRGPVGRKMGRKPTRGKHKRAS
jgi:hypothetical protein